MVRSRLTLLAVGLAAVLTVVSSSAFGASSVVGGQTIQVQTAPWTVYVQQSSGSLRFLCTGSVVDASHVLTAAHCVFNDAGALAAPTAFQVRAGVSNFSAALPTDLEQDRGVSGVRVHPGYVNTGKVGPDDVAVLTLVSPLDLSGPAVQAVALPTAGASYPSGASVGVAGFGRQNPTVSVSGQLTWMTATVDAQGNCGVTGGLIENNAIYLCASSPTSAVCSGDSGSGLVTTGGATQVLVGVVDGSSSGCSLGGHALYAYTGAPEILQFVQGNDHPPTAPRESDATFLRLDWNPPGDAVFVGDLLTCSTGRWSDAQPAVTYSFIDSASGRVLQSGPSGSYLLKEADVGATVLCQASVANSGGAQLVVTDATFEVKPAPQVKIVRVPAFAATRGGDALLRVTLVSPAGLHGRFAVCIDLPKGVAGKLCRSTVSTDGAPTTMPFLFHFHVKATAPLGGVPVAISAIAGLSKASASTVMRVTRGSD